MIIQITRTETGLLNLQVCCDDSIRQCYLYIRDVLPLSACLFSFVCLDRCSQNTEPGTIITSSLTLCARCALPTHFRGLLLCSTRGRLDLAINIMALPKADDASAGPTTDGNVEKASPLFVHSMPPASPDLTSPSVLPPKDGGIKAWLFSIGACIVEITAWGKHLRNFLFQVFKFQFSTIHFHISVSSLRRTRTSVEHIWRVYWLTGSVLGFL